MTPEQREDARVKAQRIVNAGGTENADYAVAVGFLSMIAQVEALTVPQGWKCVPIKPTEDMKRAAVKDAPLIIKRHYAKDGQFTGTIQSLDSEMFGDCYASMLDAAPTIPAIPGTKEGA